MECLTVIVLAPLESDANRTGPPTFDELSGGLLVMDYLATLPVEVWALIIGAAVDHVGVNWPPSDLLTFCLLSTTYGKIGQLPTYEVPTRFHIRLVCSCFKALADQFPARSHPRTQRSVVPISNAVSRFVSPIRTRSGIRNLSHRAYACPYNASLTSLKVSLCGTSNRTLSVNRQLKHLWEDAGFFPNVCIITIDGACGDWSSYPFWTFLSESFPRLESLAIRPFGGLHLTYDDLGALTMTRLRHLHLPRVIIADLPSLPLLQMLKVHRFSSWNGILRRTPALTTLSVSSSAAPRLLSPTRTRLRCLECSLTDSDLLKSFDFSTAEGRLDLLILTVPGSGIGEEHHRSYQACVATLVFEIYNSHCSEKIQLNFASVFENKRRRATTACVKKGVLFDRKELETALMV